ncbi:MAG: glycosyltransferase family 4 protein [Ktedonobacteraceae bacterium]|nr:glycosyltransferase family 4 protein [Ktedonobacteraceae bacterium]
MPFARAKRNIIRNRLHKKDKIMRIAQIAPPWIAIPPKNYGGTESVIYNLVEQQVAQGHDVTLFAPGDTQTSAKLVSFFPKSLLREGVPWTMHLKAFYHLQKSLEVINTQNFDIVHTHLSSGADLYVFPLTANLSTPHVTTLHSHFPFDHGISGWVGNADRYYMDWAPSVPIVSISEAARAQTKEPLNFVGVVYNGIEVKQLPPTRKKRDTYFTWLGRFVPEKGPHLAIEAAKQANVPLILAGTIDRHVKESVTYFQEIIKPQVDGDQIKYIGPVNAQEKARLLRGACGFLNPIEWEEPFGMVMVEAMAFGCPVISFARGAAPEIVIHGQNGFLVQNLAEMIEYIPHINEIDRDALPIYVEQNFSAHAMATKYQEIYEKVISMSKTRKRAGKKASTKIASTFENPRVAVLQ